MPLVAPAPESASTAAKLHIKELEEELESLREANQKLYNLNVDKLLDSSSQSGKKQSQTSMPKSLTAAAVAKQKKKLKRKSGKRYF